MRHKYIMYDPAEFNKIEIKSVENSDEITHLRSDLAAVTAERDRMREALEPLAAITLWTDKYPDGPLSVDDNKRYVDPQWIVRARAAIGGVKEPESPKAETEFFVFDEFAPLPEPASLWQHKKTGGIYEIVGECQIESTNTPGVLYRNTSTGVTWVRPKEEFFDGRFVEWRKPEPALLATLKEPDERLNLRNAECLPSTVAAKESASLWRDIESAPRDGTRIVGCSIYKDENGNLSYGWIADGYFTMCDDWYFSTSNERWEVTHWMPLPEPPR